LLQAWGFSLPMASAILTVLWPEEFTVYDVRVCDELGDFHSLVHRTHAESVWQGYCAYVSAVREAAAPGLSLRDKDRCLWARSAARHLQADLASGFAGTAPV
jgi:hypothetical protein